MIIKRKLFSKEKKENKKTKVAAGVGAIGAGLGVLEHVNRHGEVSGRKRLYHVTDEKNVKSILEEGLKGSKALDPNNPTNSMMEGRAIKDGRKLVYVGENRIPTNGMKSWYKRKGKNAKELKISIDYDVYKNLEQTDKNPELFNTTNAKDWVKEKYKHNELDGLGDFNKKTDRFEYIDKDGKKREITKVNGKSSKEYYKDVIEKVENQKPDTGEKIYHKIYKGGKGSPTKIIEGDIESKFIKGGKGYEKNSLKKVMNYAKNNPKRFAKGVGKTTIGVGAIVGGGKLIKDSTKKKKDK